MTNTTATALHLAPLLPVWGLAVLGAAALAVCVWAAWRRARGAVWRAALFAVLLLCLGNPQLVREARTLRPDIVLLVTDESASMQTGERARDAAAARDALAERIARLPGLELRSITVPEAGNAGTRLFDATARALADIPRPRLAGVLMLTDGQVHDAPSAPDFDAPLHVLIPARGEETDRQLRILEAPGFGMVGQDVTLRVIAEDQGPVAPGAQQTSARLTIRHNGATARTETIRLGREYRFTLPVTHSGTNLVDLEIDPLSGEVSTSNNRQIISINGVRDRLRVLLVSGEPHQGERTWRRLLKADAAVDLVHFTILRPPEKDDLTPMNELSLIPFPVRELFQIRLRDFDLVIFDRFQNRGLLPSIYLENIADYVQAGGALLFSAGPEFIGVESLAGTPLAQILPAQPGAMITGAFRPQIPATGQRHPVTANLPGAHADAAPSWGPWYRRITPRNVRGDVVMTDEQNVPLLVLSHEGRGRVAMLLSDQIWLWSRGHQGGGPQAELLRRVAHWLMREPELEEETLAARIEAGRLIVERRSLSTAPPPAVTVTPPTGPAVTQPLTATAPGQARLDMPAPLPGPWQVDDGTRRAFAVTGSANPPEARDLRATATRLASAVQASRGTIRFLGTSGLPQIRRTAPAADAGGAAWIGLRQNRDYLTTGLSVSALLPPWLAFILIIGLAITIWYRESR